MAGGIITVKGGEGDAYFLSSEGKEVLKPSIDVSVKASEEFAGMTLKDALDEARRFIISAVKVKMEQKTRGKSCFITVRNVRVDYKIKFGFQNSMNLERKLEFKKGAQVLKKGEVGDEFFFVQSGIIDIEGVEYHGGSIFGRAAFADGVRKKDAFAKTDAVVIAINKDHPDLMEKLPVILDKFSEEVRRVHEVRPDAKLDKIKIDE